jgi:hypothetical protein
MLYSLTVHKTAAAPFSLAKIVKSTMFVIRRKLLTISLQRPHLRVCGILTWYTKMDAVTHQMFQSNGRWKPFTIIIIIRLRKHAVTAFLVVRNVLYTMNVGEEQHHSLHWVPAASLKLHHQWDFLSKLISCLIICSHTYVGSVWAVFVIMQQQ